MHRNENGFSLVEIMIAAGILGIVSLGVLRLQSNMSNITSSGHTSVDETELALSVRMLLQDRNYCRISLAGNGPEGSPTNPVTFYKVDIDEDHEGLDLELFLSNQAGDLRTIKKFSAATSPENVHGKIHINSIKLIMNNGTGSSYVQSLLHNDIGQVRMEIQKKSGSATRTITKSFDVNVVMSTDASGESTILSCSSTGGTGSVSLTNLEIIERCTAEITGATNYTDVIECNPGELLIESFCHARHAGGLWQNAKSTQLAGALNNEYIGPAETPPTPGTHLRCNGHGVYTRGCVRCLREI